MTGLSVRDNVRVAAEVALGRTAATDAAVEACLRLWQLTPCLGVHSEHLPHGIRRWVELARLDVMDCPVLFLDESASGLSEQDRVFLVGQLRRWRTEGRAVVLIEHDLGLIGQLCDRLVVMADGRVIAEGTPAEVACRPEVNAAIGDRLELNFVENERSGRTLGG
jgi:ABC-type branched-subunit amino acid transport system ATPase component